jgi:hypothetical protein
MMCAVQDREEWIEIDEGSTLPQPGSQKAEVRGRAYVDFATVPEHQLAIDARLVNWANAMRGGDKQSGKAAPMFVLYRSSDARRVYGTETVVPVNRSDAVIIGKEVGFLPDKHRKAIHWCYVHPGSPARAAREIGVTHQRLAELVIDARDMLINRNV